MAVASKNEVITQLKVTAFSEKLFSIAGNAMFTDDIKKVPINEVTATIARIENCFFVHSINTGFILKATKILFIPYPLFNRH
jgi:hypothetical protein